MTEESKEEPQEKTVRYVIDPEKVKGPSHGTMGVLMFMYTCNKCETKQAVQFTKDAYTKGIVIVNCKGCESMHLIADNLGWFHD